ncbi:MAG TPA: hypothetical protein VFW44_00565 [Bryobacteraceae bacterium]|nr:hypothetical protein [Bryobacteraceae bacterium]
MRILAINLLITLVPVCALRADPPSIAFVGHGAPAIPGLAPGQIVTIFGTGFPVPSDPVIAQKIPLPTVLGGISALLRQTIGPQQISVPMISVAPVGNCTALTNCAPMLAVTLQVPAELTAYPPGSLGPPNTATLTISDQSGDTASIAIAANLDSVHILTPADAGLASSTSSVITHADGSLVTSEKPATAGEELVAYATGLGSTTPNVVAGAITPSPAPKANNSPQLSFNFAPNAPAWNNVIEQPTIIVSAAVFAGLSPQNVGLYQLNFVVPAPPSTTVPCSTDVRSNVTMTVIGSASFDGAPFCVATH